MQNIMAKELNIIEQIGFVGANSVTDEEYREFWGESREETLEEMKVFMSKFDAKMETEVYNPVAEEGQLPKPEKKVAATRLGDFIVYMDESYEDNEDVKAVLEKIQKLAEQLSKMLEKRQQRRTATVKVKGRSVAKKKDVGNVWDVKLVALQTGTGKPLAAGAPVVIRSMDSPVETVRTVAKVFSPGKKVGKAGEGMTLKSGFVKIVEPTGGLKGVMVDVGGLTMADLVGVDSVGTKGSRSPKGGGPK